MITFLAYRVIGGHMTLEDVPSAYRDAVQLKIDEIKNQI